ncbi:cystathionine gamma-synthase [Stereum hirsutum FP-91666 SS1]|uniref:cystathionine gamma-synthase n=1 Tax=Stereum hirsutum (strain FP-91666) TaxID=721885 RepID=UPI000440A4FF|nr:cystathionine gamma-synthase [Stereum hirsutum FP-91666 SS1]EIM88570.1 cystathionine gamma-synthase [Stereum hirsutum FP-91666 SS1]
MAPKSDVSRLSGTDLIHADEAFSDTNVAPSISVSTTFKQAVDGPLAAALDITRDAEMFRSPDSKHVYSRYTQQTYSRVEAILSKINHGYAITYSSGLSAAHAAFLLLKPKRVAIRNGYHGVHGVLEIYKRERDVEIIDLDDDFRPGDVCWLETPLNPTGQVRDIKYYADKIHAVGGKLGIDATFGPPPLSYPFKWGADVVMHSGTKYFGGHSDMLCGILVVKTINEWGQLLADRTMTGTMMGSLESWLLLRSLRTLHLRVPRQSSNATVLAHWLHKIANTPEGKEHDGVPGGMVLQVWHDSLQGRGSKGDGKGGRPEFEPKEQMEGGFAPTFGMMLTKPEYAAALPFALEFFIPATSLGGVESLIEQRARSDPGADPRLIRLSIGVEDVEDLKSDLRRAFNEIKKGKAKL